MLATKKSYIDFNPGSGYPAGSGIFYECLECNEIIPSKPEDDIACRCRNIMIDVGYGRLKIFNHNTFQIFQACEEEE